MLNLTTIGADQSWTAHPLFEGYGLPEPGRYDEAFDQGGKARPHWRGLLEWLDAVGKDGYQAAADELARLRTESGVAFATDNATRDGTTDALPVMLSAADWAALESGVAQRAALAEAAVRDVYTTRRTLESGVVPPGLVYGGQAFAAHCAGWKRPPQHFLHVYEVDVARTADGGWVVLADRLDAPLGDGWLLANRIATTQAYADLFIDLGVRRIAGHYASFQDHLDRMMSWDGRMALLTGGEDDPRFFSHAYFARYLSANLIEPADLTVRDGAAFVKTLDGLKRIDLLLRGVADSALDALHRPGRAAMGAPALSLAARSGALKAVNALGSAVFANRALAPFAHRMAEALLGEDLRLPDAPCLWLGGARAREQVFAERDAWRIEHLTADLGEATLWQDEDAEEAPKEKLARLGESYCAVQAPALAVTPVWTEQGIRPGSWMMRVFASRTEDGWSVAPGGVASIVGEGQDPGDLGFGKDVWVLPSEDTKRREQASGVMRRRIAEGHLRRTGLDLLSRVADELYWLGRNAERAENVLRVLALCLNRHLAGNRTDADPQVLSDLAEIHAKPATDLSGEDRFKDALQRLTRNTGEISGIPAMLRILRAGAVRARSSISAESWRYIERLCSDRRWRGRGTQRQAAGLARLIEDSLQALAAFAGSAQENLTRNYAWRFLEIGRRIERGVQIAQLAEKLAGEVRATEETYLRAWLTLSDSTAAYRARYMMTADAAAVIDLLVLDETNPRSLAYQLAALEQVLGSLPSEVPYRRPEHRKALALLTEIRLADADVLAQVDHSGQRAALVGFAQRCCEDLAEVSDLISHAYFAHADVPEALVSMARFEPATRLEKGT